MRVLFTCMECMLQDNKPSDDFHLVEYNEAGRYEATCKRGHRITAVAQEQRFEVLFEIGAPAILDGYYREAVASFTAAMERFFEFALRTLLRDTEANQFDSAWNNVAKQSERQLGAFIFVWALRFGKCPRLLGNRQVQFRNDVVHKGLLPTKTEAVAYGEEVFSLIKEKIMDLKKRSTDDVFAVVMSDFRKRSEGLEGEDLVTVSMPRSSL
ncbi:hypothetical protein [Rhizobium mongolense]